MLNKESLSGIEEYQPEMAEPDAAFVGEPVVEDIQVEITSPGQSQGIGGSAGRRHLVPVPAQHQPNNLACVRVIVHEQNMLPYLIHPNLCPQALTSVCRTQARMSPHNVIGE